MKNFYDIAIIGAGASGLSSAITVKRDRPDLSVAIFEKKEEAGIKVGISGKGKCNISNINAPCSDVTISFFKSLGISFIEKDEGRLYPSFEDGKKVVKTLVLEAKKLGVEIYTNKELLSIEKDEKNNFILDISGERITASKVLMATGGKSYPKCGTTGDGYVFLRKMGHRIETLIPGLTGIDTLEDTSSLGGLRIKGEVKLYKNNNLVFSERGEVQFAGGRISGIVIMNASLYIRKDEEYILELDLTDGTKKIYHPTGLRGWKEAQITCGGVPYDEVNCDMESTIIPGLYISGELLNYQGKCGGYNLNNAWISGIKAGHGMGK